MIGNCILGNRQGYFSQGLLIGLRIINRPQSKPHQFAFYDMWGEGCLLLPISSMGTFLLDLRPEAGYTFDPFWSTNLLQKVYVCVCERFLCSLFCPIGTHMGEQRCSGGFVTQCHGLNLLPNMYAVFKSRLISSARICYWTQHNSFDSLTLGWRNLDKLLTVLPSISVAAHQV